MNDPLEKTPAAPRFGYLLKKFPRLSETFVLGEILAQEALGREVRIFARRPVDDEPRHPALTGLRAGVEVAPRARAVDPWSLLFGQPDASALCRRLGSMVARGQAFEHPGFPRLVSEALHLLTRTRDLGIAHIHTHFASDAAVVAWICHGLGGPTYSITVHAKDIYRQPISVPMLEALFVDAAMVVTVCDANVSHLEPILFT